MTGDKRMGLYIPRALIEDTQLSPPLRMVLSAMIAAADEYGICRMPAREIGARCGMQANTVTQNRRILAELGYIERVMQERERGAGSYNFRILRHGKAARYG